MQLKPKPTIIASYPRSGSTWLRFILANFYYPDVEHTFETVNCHIPSIDDTVGMRKAIELPFIFKTHLLRHGQQIIFLHRHVGDVLISEWWYKRKIDPEETRDLCEYMEAVDYGKGWREHIDFYFPCSRSIGYDELPHVAAIMGIISPLAAPPRSLENLVDALLMAIERSSFDKLRAIEEEVGLGEGYPHGDPTIPFVRTGKSGQWRELPAEAQSLLIEKNYIQLKALGYL